MRTTGVLLLSLVTFCQLDNQPGAARRHRSVLPAQYGVLGP